MLKTYYNIFLFTGTAGNTGIGLAHMCMALGYKCVVYIPDDQTKEKIDMLKGYYHVFTHFYLSIYSMSYFYKAIIYNNINGGFPR